jgi:hypothetical protein
VKTQVNKPKKVVLAYSGGLDTSIIIPWLKENYQCEVIAMIGDVGQQEDLEGARKKALATGASSAYIEDLRDEFVREYIWPTLRAGAVYEHTYLLGTSMARPVLAKRHAFELPDPALEKIHREIITLSAQNLLFPRSGRENRMGASEQEKDRGERWSREGSTPEATARSRRRRRGPSSSSSNPTPRSACSRAACSNATASP